MSDDGEKPCWVRSWKCCSRSSPESILSHIFNNAIWSIRQNRHTTKKEIFIAVQELEEAKNIIIIKDSGIGIQPDIYSNLFKPFLQLDLKAPAWDCFLQ